MIRAGMGTEIVSKYLERLSNDFVVTPSGKGCFISTPFIRPDGEGIELELESLPNGRVRLSDMGSTLGYLFVNGLTMNEATLEQAKSMSGTYGVSLNKSVLEIDGEPPAVDEALHNLIQAALAVTALSQIFRYSPT